MADDSRIAGDGADRFAGAALTGHLKADRPISFAPDTKKPPQPVTGKVRLGGVITVSN